MLLECIICFGELEEIFSSTLQLAALTLKASPSTKKLRRACIESFRHFDTLGSQISRFSSDIDFVASKNIVLLSLISHMHC